MVRWEGPIRKSGLRRHPCVEREVLEGGTRAYSEEDRDEYQGHRLGSCHTASSTQFRAAHRVRLTILQFSVAIRSSERGRAQGAAAALSVRAVGGTINDGRFAPSP
jgi:hypothetical protein